MPPQNPFSLLDQEEKTRPPAPAPAAPTLSPKNPFLAIDQADQTEQQQVRTSTQQAAQTTPDKRAESLKLSLRTGLPTSVIERNFDEIKQRSQIAETPYAQIQRESPGVFQWAKEPDHAAVAADDMENLGFLEWVLTAPSKAFAQTVNQIRYSELRYKSMFGTLSQAEQDAMGAFKYHSELGGQLGAGNSWFRKSVTGAGQLLAQSIEPAKYAVVGGLEGLPFGALGGSIIPGVGTVGGALATATVTARAGLMYGVFKTTAMQETAGAYDEMLAFRDERGQPLDPGVAKVAALTVGGLNGLIEQVGLEAFLKRFPGLDKLSGAASRGAVKTALKNPTVRAAFAKLAKEYAGSLTAETATEVAQRAVTIAGEELSKVASGIETRPTADVWDDLVNEAANAIPTFALGLAPGPMIALANDAAKAKRAEQSKLLFTALGEGAAASKTLARAPDAVQRLAHEITKDGPIETVYAPLDTWATYWQSKGLDPAAVAADVTGKPDAYADALAHQGADGNLAIPTAVYAAKLAGTEHNAFFTNELRLGNPDEFNAREVEALKTSIDQVAKTVIAEAQADPAEQAFVQLRDAIQQQLTEGGKFGQPTAEKLAALVQAGFGTLASRAGFDPLEIYQGYGLRVQRSDIASAEAAAATPRDELTAGERLPLPATESLSEPPGGGVPGPGPESMPPAMAGLESAADIMRSPDIQAILEEQHQAHLRALPNAAEVPGINAPPANLAQTNLGAAILRYVAEDPTLIQRAAEMRARAAAVPRGIDIIEAPPAAEHAAVVGTDQPAGPANDAGISAKFIGWQPGFEDIAAFPLYTIEGGPSHGTTVTEKELTDAGIPIPPTPPLTEFNQSTRGIQTFYQSGEPSDPNFYSRLTRTVTEAKQNRATGSQWKAMIRNSKIGINKDEFALARVEDLEDGKSYSKDEVLAWLQVNTPKLTAVVLSGESEPDEDEVRDRAQEIFDEMVQEAESEVDLDDIIGRATTYEDEVEEEVQKEDAHGNPMVDEDGDPIYETQYVTRYYPAIEGGYKPNRRRGYGLVDRDETEIIEDADSYDDEDDAQEAAEKYLRNIEMEPYWEMIREQAEENVDFSDAEERAREELGSGNGGRGPKFPSYVLPGQEDNDTYREVFIAAEPMKVFLTRDEVARKIYQEPFDALDAEHQGHVTRYIETDRPSNIPRWNDGHSDYDFVENPIVRVRLNIRSTEGEEYEQPFVVKSPAESRGPQKWQVAVQRSEHLIEHVQWFDTEQEARDYVATQPPQKGRTAGQQVLFLEEVQPPSGEKQFLVTPTKQLVEGELIPRPLGESKFFRTKEEADTYAKEITGIVTKQLTGNQGKMPSLFIDNWREIGFKWALHYANALGLDGVAWTTGAQQAERYSLSKRVKSIDWVPYALNVGTGSNRTFRSVKLTLLDYDYEKPLNMAVDQAGTIFQANGPVRLAGQVQGNTLAQLIGKELATQILEKEDGTLEGKGLKVGGEGLTKLYEVDFRNVVNGIPAIKKNGGKTTSVPIVQKLEYTVHQLIGDEYKAKVEDWLKLTPEQRAAHFGPTEPEDLHEMGERVWPRHFFEIRDENEQVIKEFVSNTLAYQFVKANRHQPVQQPALLFTPAMKAALGDPQPMFQGGPTTRRGSITFAPGQTTINLFAQANLSTFLHETGHLFLEVIGDLHDRVAKLDPATLTPQQTKLLADYQTILKSFGVTSRGEITTAHHEQWARSFETYLMEGRAPSAELRSAFARFASWLVGIYKSLTALNAPLSPEIRGVMDRMVATDDAISRAERDGHLQPLFLTPEQAGMSPARFELYRDALTEASLRSREALNLQLMSEVSREQTTQWKQAQTETRAQVEGEVHDMPVYKALAAMTRGTKPDGSPLVEGEEPAPMRMSKQMLVEQFGAQRLREIPRTTYTVEGGLDPATIADAYGFSSPDALLTAISQAKPMKQLIAQETEKRMLQEHGSILLDGTLHEKAQAAALDESRDVVLRDELATLIKLKRQVSPFEQLAVKEQIDERIYERRWLEAEAKLRIAIAEGYKQVEIDKLKADVRNLKAAARSGPKAVRDALPKAAVLRELAQATVARMQVRALNPSIYWTAARRASDKATQAAARQDFDGAIVAKQEELINVALYREIARVKDDVAIRVAAARNMGKPSMLKRLLQAGEGYHDQVADVLDRYEFAQVPAKALQRRTELRKFLDGIEASGRPVDLPRALLDDVQRINYKELTVQELFGISDGLQAIVHLARLKNRLLAAQEKRAFDVVRNELGNSIRSNVAQQTPRLEFRPKDEKWRKLSGAIAAHRKIAFIAEMLDGHQKDGPATRSLVRPLNQAGDAEEVRRLNDGQALWGIVTTHFPAALTGGLNTMQFIPAIGGSLSLEGRIALALNWGTKTGQDRVLSDPRLRANREQVQAILDTLDKHHWEFIQALWNFVGQYRQEIIDVEKKVNGVAPQMVEGVDVQTKFGTIKGAYYPLVYDTRLAPRAAQLEQANAARASLAATYVRQTTAHGFTEKRLEHVELPLRLDLGVAFHHVDQVIHYLTHRVPLMDVTRLIRDPVVSKAIHETAGDQVYRQFTNWLGDLAVGALPGGEHLIDDAATWVRPRLQLAALGLNVWTSVQQPLGLFNGMDEIGVRNVMRGLRRWLTDAAQMENTVAFVTNKSNMMLGRVGTSTQDLSDLRAAFRTQGGFFDQMVRKVSGDTLTQHAILDGMLWHIGMMQRVADMPVWLGRYEAALEENPEDDARAVALADEAVLKSQGGGNIKDLAGVQRGRPAVRAWLMFYSYGNLVLNQNIRAFERTNFRSPNDLMKLLGSLSLINLMPAVATVTLGMLFRRRVAPDDPEKFERWWITEVAKETLSGAMNGLVLIRELTPILTSGVRGYEGPAGARFISNIYELAGQLKQGVNDEALWKAANSAAGVVFGYPALQAQRTVEGWRALQAGKETNPLVLVTGPAPKKAAR
jgi:Large polyvalent protein associated domain 22